MEGLDKDIEAKLEQRASNMIAAWIEVFGSSEDKEKEEEKKEDDSPATPNLRRRRNRSMLAKKGGSGEAKLESGLVMTPIVFEILMSDQRLQLSPPILESRSVWMKQLREWLGLVCDLSRLHSGRYDQTEEEEEVKRYRSILAKTISNGKLEKAVEAIESKIGEVEGYVKEWLQYQTLWDMEASAVFQELGDSSIEPWKQLLLEVKNARSTFDTHHTEKSFGPVVVSFGQVQSKVGFFFVCLFYEELLSEIMMQFPLSFPYSHYLSGEPQI